MEIYAAEIRCATAGVTRRLQGRSDGPLWVDSSHSPDRQRVAAMGGFRTFDGAAFVACARLRRGSVRKMIICRTNPGASRINCLAVPEFLSGNCSPAWLPISFLFPIHLIAGGVRQFSDLVGYRRACRAGCPDSSGRNFARLSMDSARGEWAAALARAALQRDPGRSAVAVRAVLAHHRHGSCRRQPLSHDDNGGHAGTRGAMKSRRRQCDVAIE